MSTIQSPPRQGIPFRPDPQAWQEMLVRNLTCAAEALVQHRGNTLRAADQVRDYPGAVRIINRAAVAPTSTTSAASLKQSTIAYLASILKGATAIGAMIERATKLEFGRGGAIWCPGLSADETGIGFVPEGGAIPVMQGDVSAGTTLALQKLAFIVPTSEELLQYSNFDALLRVLIAAKLQIGIESLMYDSTEGTTVRPSGLRFGIDAEAASDDGTMAKGALDDLALIISKVAKVAGLSDTIVIASPLQAAKLWGAYPLYKLPIFASAALEDGAVMAVACSGVAICGSPNAPQLEYSDAGTVHMESDPSAIVADDGTAAWPVVSLFQSRMVSLRVICPMTWSARASSGVVSWVSNVSW